jgi:phospholipid/cholesterol/gamma-HCH transport system substrate-binding protein
MKDQRKTEIKVGIVVIASLILFIWILGWAKNFSLTAKQRFIDIRFENVAGLEVGDYVTVNGVKKGNVESFNIRSNDVLVKLALDSDIVLKSDAEFSIIMLDLMGGKRVEIKPGNNNEELNYNEVQRGIFYADIPTVISMLGSVQEDIVASLHEVRITLTSLNEYLTDRDLQQNIKNSVAGLESAVGKLNVVLDENREGLRELISSGNDLTNSANIVISENRENISESLEKLNRVLEETDSLMRTINKLTAETERRENNLGKLLYDETMIDDLRETLINAKKLVEILVNQLERKGIKVDVNIF